MLIDADSEPLSCYACDGSDFRTTQLRIGLRTYIMCTSQLRIVLWTYIMDRIGPTAF
jgi:hypothetical protein